MDTDVLLVGNLTMDCNIFCQSVYKGPGGSSWYIAKILENFGLASTILSPYGKDFPLSLLFPTRIEPKYSTTTNTLLFTNTYDNKGRRTQQVKHMSAFPNTVLEEVSIDLVKKTGIIIVCPVINNISIDKLSFHILKHAKNNLKVLLPQGFFRSYTKTGYVNVSQPDSSLIDSFKQYDVLIFSDEDIPDADTWASKWSTKSIVIVTKSSYGVSIYDKENRLDIPSFYEALVKDSTGAGDSFAAGFSFAFNKGLSLKDASIFGNATALLSLRLRSNELQLNTKDVIKLVQERKRSF